MSRDSWVTASLLALVAALSSVSCRRITNDTDEDHIPYKLTGMRVLFFPSRHHDSVDLEQFSASYDERKSAVARCGELAHAEKGRRKRLHDDDDDDDENDDSRAELSADWSYVCCTITASSNCKTKVR